MSASGSMKSTRGAFIEPSKSYEKIQTKDNSNSGNDMSIEMQHTPPVSFSIYNNK